MSNKMLTRNLLAFALLSLSIGGCATKTPTLSSDPNAEITFDGLHEVQYSAADKAWAMPGIDLSGYSKILVQGAGIEYRPGGVSGRSSIGRSQGGPYEVTEEQKTRFRQVVGETLLEELGKSQKFTLVNEAGADVLLVRVALLDVVSYVPEEAIGRSETFLSTVGEATLVLEIRDSMSEAILVRAVDRDAAEDGSRMTRSSRVTNAAEVKRLVRRWVSTLRERLDSFSGYSSTANAK